MGQAEASIPLPETTGVFCPECFRPYLEVDRPSCRCLDTRKQFKLKQVTLPPVTLPKPGVKEVVLPPVQKKVSPETNALLKPETTRPSSRPARSRVIPTAEPRLDPHVVPPPQPRPIRVSVDLTPPTESTAKGPQEDKSAILLGLAVAVVFLIVLLLVLTGGVQQASNNAGTTTVLDTSSDVDPAPTSPPEDILEPIQTDVAEEELSSHKRKTNIAVSKVETIQDPLRPQTPPGETAQPTPAPVIRIERAKTKPDSSTGSRSTPAKAGAKRDRPKNRTPQPAPGAIQKAPEARIKNARDQPDSLERRSPGRPTPRSASTSVSDFGSEIVVEAADPARSAHPRKPIVFPASALNLLRSHTNAVITVDVRIDGNGKPSIESWASSVPFSSFLKARLREVILNAEWTPARDRNGRIVSGRVRVVFRPSGAGR